MEYIIPTILGWGVLVSIILYQRNTRNKKYGKICPKCGHKINPKLTGIRYKYDYQCKHCGYRPYL